MSKQHNLQKTNRPSDLEDSRAVFVLFPNHRPLTACHTWYYGTLENRYDTVVLAVAHDQFKELQFNRCSKTNMVLYDIKSILDKSTVDGRL